MIDLQDLRIFVRISELDSFTQTAIALGITQPTISRTIKKLEEAWGGELFHRTGRGVALTAFGEVAVVRARALLYEAERVSEDLLAYNRLPSGNVSFALPPSIVPAVVPELVKQFRRDVPGIQLKIYEGFSDQIERWLSVGEVEVAIYSKYREGETRNDGALLESCMLLAAPPGTQPMPPEVEFADLAKYPLVLAATPNRLRVNFEAIARRLRIALSSMWWRIRIPCPRRNASANIAAAT